MSERSRRPGLGGFSRDSARGRLEAAYRDARHVRGLALVGRLEANAQSLGWRLRELGRAADATAAGAAALHLVAALEALAQTVAEGHGCCRIRLARAPPRG